MSKDKSEKRKETNNDIEKELLLQGYSRYVSRAHTIFSTLFNILLSIIFGTLGVVVSLIEIEIIPWNKFYFLNVVFIDLSLITIALFIAAYQIYDSRQKRSEIVTCLKNLGTS